MVQVRILLPLLSRHRAPEVGVIRVLVTGGRHYGDRARVREVLDQLHRERGVRELIEGGATGADLLANRWANEAGVPVVTVKPDWRRGRQAGVLRNAKMMALKPDLVVAFPGARGTADCVARAKLAGVEVLMVPLDWEAKNETPLPNQTRP